MGYGGTGGWPFEFGGGPTEEEAIYQALKSNVGIGGSATSEDGIDALWRRCKAMAIAAVSRSSERAILQAFPQLATSFIPVYEEVFGIVPPEDATEEDRRLAIVIAYVEKAAENEAELAQDMADIDARFSMVNIPRELAAYVQFGKAFEPQDGAPTFGGYWVSAPGPNYSSDFYVPVKLTISGTMPTPVDLASITKAKRALARMLPSWVDFAVITSTGPFLLGVSPLGLTCLS